MGSWTKDLQQQIFLALPSTWQMCSTIKGKSYLSNRKQYVTYNDSKPYDVTPCSGVPQGSNLDCILLQNVLQKIVTWCVKNKLPLNITKCHVVSYTRKKEYCSLDYSICNASLIRCNAVKDLGVIFDSSFTFDDHIAHITTSSLKMLGFVIRKCKVFGDIETLKQVYYSYVRSKLEYCCIVLTPYYYCQKNALERVQRIFLKFLYFTAFSIYPQRGFDHATLLSKFDFKTLEFRRFMTHCENMKATSRPMDSIT
ncbi:uncharacterized protein LOC135138659 [Zophobas morio]|uniref:uncharacterized protein LOC135138659 n=1 Tax=Zophobas morio TaxID=2755281 RepID=UPI00308294EA